MDRKLVLENIELLPLNRVRLMFASDPRHSIADCIIERQVKLEELCADFTVGESYQLSQIL